MFDFQISRILADYLHKIEDETGHQLKILESTDLGLTGMLAAFRYHPDYILIIVRSGVRRSDPDLERSIAHEATHGLLLHKMGYCRPVFKPTATDDDRKDVQLVFTMVDDIVVNRIIMENGFPPFGSEYLKMVKREIKASSEGEDFYRQFSDDYFFNTVLMVSRYIIAWGFLKYFKLETSELEVIRKFTKSFRVSYPKEYQTASRIKEIILRNDIFTAPGQCKTIDSILRLWNLVNLVDLETIS